MAAVCRSVCHCQQGRVIVILVSDCHFVVVVFVSNEDVVVIVFVSDVPIVGNVPVCFCRC